MDDMFDDFNNVIVDISVERSETKFKITPKIARKVRTRENN